MKELKAEQNELEAKQDKLKAEQNKLEARQDKCNNELEKLKKDPKKNKTMIELLNDKLIAMTTQFLETTKRINSIGEVLKKTNEQIQKLNMDVSQTDSEVLEKVR